MDMGMRTSSAGASGASAGTAGAAAWQQRQQGFKALADSLKSGNIDDAKKAYAQMSANAPGGAISNPNSPLAQMGKALANGDLAGAQKVMTDMQAHHHHHKGGSSTPPAQSVEQPAPPTATSGNLLNVVV